MTGYQEISNPKPAIFITTDFNEQAPARYPLDRISIRESIADTAFWALHNGHRVVVRDVPAVSGMLKHLFQSSAGSTDDLSVEPETASVPEIVSKHHPHIAVFAGGCASTASDFSDLQKRGGIKLIPLPETGGASRDLFEQHKTELLQDVVNAIEQKPWGGLRKALECCK